MHLSTAKEDLKKTSLKDLLIALSYANLILIWPWYLFNSNYLNYFYNTPTGWPGYFALFFLLLLIAGAFYILIFCAHKTKNWIPASARMTFLGVCLKKILMIVLIAPAILPILAIRKISLVFPVLLNFEVGLSKHHPVLTFVLLGSIFYLSIIIWTRFYYKTLRVMLLIFSPFLLFTLGNGCIKSFREVRLPIHHERPHVLPAQQGSPKQRVLWILFDELEYEIPFEKEFSIYLPELLRLKKESFNATRAYPPARRTRRSIPSLTTGKLVTHVDPKGSEALELTINKDLETKSLWGEAPTIFSEVKKTGLSVAILGWYAPYCRVFKDVDYCKSFAMIGGFEEFLELSHGVSFWRDLGLNLKQIARGILQAIPRNFYIYLGGEDRATRYKHTFDFFNRQSAELASNPDINFIFLHLPYPHEPFFFDAKEDAFKSVEFPLPEGYFYNLKLVNQIFLEIRKKMEANGTWDQTTIIISSDHWWKRKPEFYNNHSAEVDKRIPFIIKLPGIKAGLSFDRPLNTVITHDLVLAMINGKIKSYRDIANFIEKNSTIAEIPYRYDW